MVRWTSDIAVFEDDFGATATVATGHDGLGSRHGAPAAGGWLSVQGSLVERARHGDEMAFGQLVTTLGGRLYSIAYHVLRDAAAAEDAVQDALVQAWRELPGLRDPERFEAWATRITVRSAYAEQRRRRRRGPVQIQIAEDGPEYEGDRTREIADHDQLERAFRRLSTDHRAVLILKHYAGLADPEIAHALDVPEGTVRSRLFHAMRSLRAALEADDRATAERGIR